MPTSPWIRRRVSSTVTLSALTSRDVICKQRQPWDSAKGFDESAPISSIVPVNSAVQASDSQAQDDATARRDSIQLQFPDVPAKCFDTNNITISCTVNDEQKQNGTLGHMVWSIPEMISILSQYNALEPGDLIFTGTPSGVGPIVQGDVVRGSLTHADSAFAFPSVQFRMVADEQKDGAE